MMKTVILMDTKGRFMDDHGDMTFARSFAQRFSAEEAERVIASESRKLQMVDDSTALSAKECGCDGAHRCELHRGA